MSDLLQIIRPHLTAEQVSQIRKQLKERELFWTRAVADNPHSEEYKMWVARYVFLREEFEVYLNPSKTRATFIGKEQAF